MNKLSVSVMALGLLLSASAMAQNTNKDTQKTNAQPATATQSKPTGQNGDAGRLQNDRSITKKNAQMKSDADQKSSDRGDRDQRSGSVSTHSKTTIGVGTNSREYRRHHRGYPAEVRFGHRHCRMVTVRARHHHRVIVRHIRRCFR